MSLIMRAIISSLSFSAAGTGCLPKHLYQVQLAVGGTKSRTMVLPQSNVAQPPETAELPASVFSRHFTVNPVLVMPVVLQIIIRSEVPRSWQMIRGADPNDLSNKTLALPSSPVVTYPDFILLFNSLLALILLYN